MLKEKELKRSKIMASIHSKDTKPELIVRKKLHSLGYRYRLHYKKIIGKPDIVLPKYNAIILVNGCFWHGHDCHLYNPSIKRSQKWEDKIKKNKQRDKKNISIYKEQGWKTLVIWECAIQGKTKLSLDNLFKNIINWLLFENKNKQISGKFSS
jgi:DNA mismatch endonuclease, patch repair protein